MIAAREYDADGRLRGVYVTDGSAYPDMAFAREEDRHDAELLLDGTEVSADFTWGDALRRLVSEANWVIRRRELLETELSAEALLASSSDLA